MPSTLPRIHRLAPAFVAGCLLAAALPAADDYAAAMHHEHAADTTSPSPAAELEPARPVATESVAYATVDQQPVTGYLAYPQGKHGRLPALIVIQEWWGLNDNVRAMTRRWAGEGYVALAVDLYGGEVAENADQAMRLVRRATAAPEKLMDNLEQARAWLAARDDVGGIGVLGWCFGGGFALRSALAMGDGIDAAVVYYGSPITDRERLAKLEAPLLGLYGGRDESNPVATVREMESTLRALGKQVEIVVYPDAQHAFANPTGERYDEAAASDAWRRATAFLAANLKR